MLGILALRMTLGTGILLPLLALLLARYQGAVD
jgi:hypothetical protein